MMGFVYKDFMVMRKVIKYYFLFVVIYTAMVATGMFTVAVLSGLVALFGMMLPMSSFSYDDLSRWDKYAAATPAGRRGIVGGKYLFALLSIGGAVALLVVIQGILYLLGVLEEDLLTLAMGTLASAGVTLLINAVVLPLLIKFGAEKSRTISMVLFVGVFAGFMVLGSVLKDAGPLPVPPAWLLQALPVALALICVGSVVISYFIALGICEKKEL